MYDTVLSMGEPTDDSKAVQLSAAAGKFCVIFIGSILIGAMTAFIVAFILKR
jgi:hypothetical protein